LGLDLDQGGSDCRDATFSPKALERRPPEERSMIEAVPVFQEPSPRVNRVPLDRPWVWLARGWIDLQHALPLALAYGIALVVASFAVTIALLYAGMIYLLLPVGAGFFLVAPVVAVGLYEISRRHELGLTVHASDVVAACRRNGAQIALLGLVLMLIHLFWVRIATLLFALFFQSGNPGWEGMIDAVFFSRVSLPFLVTGTLMGFVLAAVSFALSAVSIPMLLDRDVNVFTAIATSWTAVTTNWKPMALWAVLIVFFTGIGLVTFYLALAVTVPLIAFASWHAYRDLVS
jgi:uncharacterized membrane protein